jgi:hypothetical protein
MLFLIYRTTNKLNGKFYIGKHQTDNLNDGYLGSGKLLKRAIQKYGKENFIREILHIFETEEEMNQKEKELVVLGKNSYNLCEGGKGGFSYINREIYTTERRLEHNRKYQKHGTQACREKKVGINNPKYKFIRKQWSKLGGIAGGKIGFLGKTHTNETKQKISEANIGKHIGKLNPNYNKCWIYDTNNQNKLIDINELTNYLSLGWKKGRKIGRGY